MAVAGIFEHIERIARGHSAEDIIAVGRLAGISVGHQPNVLGVGYFAAVTDDVLVVVPPWRQAGGGEGVRWEEE